MPVHATLRLQRRVERNPVLEPPPTKTAVGKPHIMCPLFLEPFPERPACPPLPSFPAATQSAARRVSLPLRFFFPWCKVSLILAMPLPSIPSLPLKLPPPRPWEGPPSLPAADSLRPRPRPPLLPTSFHDLFRCNPMPGCALSGPACMPVSPHACSFFSCPVNLET